MRRNRRNAILLVIVAWAFGFVTNLLRVLQVGRPDRIFVSREQQFSSLAALSVQVFLVLFAALSVVIILDNFNTAIKSAKLAYLGLFLLPFAVLIVSDLINDQAPVADAVLYPLAIFALWRAQAPLQSASAVGWLTILSASISVVLGLFAQDVGTTLPPPVGDKSLWPTLLAGPYGHSNILGLALSMGIPFIFLVRHPAVRWVGLFITLFAVAWSGNRCSIVAAAIACLIYVVLRIQPKAKIIPIAIMAGGVALTVGVPLTTTDPEAFSLRGRIWTSSLDYFRESVLFGNGTNFYGIVGRSVNDFGAQAFNGHNALIHLLTTGGVLLTAAVVALVLVAYVASWKRVGPDRAVGLSFVTVLVFNSWLQNTITYSGLSEVAYSGWLALALLLFAPSMAHNKDIVSDLGMQRPAAAPAQLNY